MYALLFNEIIFVYSPGPHTCCDEDEVLKSMHLVCGVSLGKHPIINRSRVAGKVRCRLFFYPNVTTIISIISYKKASQLPLPYMDEIVTYSRVYINMMYFMLYSNGNIGIVLRKT